MPLLSRKADYAILILAWLQERPGQGCARAIADGYGLSRPFVANILKELCHKGFVTSRRGVKGGYGLARKPEEISLAQIIRALEGPIAVTECTDSIHGECGLEMGCPVRGNWHRINHAIDQALETITLAEMTRPLQKLQIDLAMPFKEGHVQALQQG